MNPISTLLASKAIKPVFSLYLLFVIGMASSLNLSAQVPMRNQPSIVGVISGTVIDSLTRKPLDYATVTLFREGGKTPVNGTLTDEKGVFKINNVSTGTYTLTITFIGYPTKTINGVKTTLSKPDNNLGAVVLSPGANTLAAVVVQGEAPVIENKIDKLVFNAEKDVTSAGGNATDVLRKVPMLSVDMDGNVSLRGSQNIRILINGKPSGALASNVADILKSMPADEIKNVEVITSPSAKYDAEGSAGIINIITKKKNVAGVSGSVSGGVGTRQNNGNINLNINKNRLSLTGNLGMNAGWPQTTITEFSSSNTELQTSSSSYGTSRTNRRFYNGSASLSYDFNNFNSVSSSFKLRDGAFKFDGTTANSNNSPANGLIEYTAAINNRNHFGSFDWNTDYVHKFKKQGEELSIAGQWSRSQLTTDYTSLYTGFTQNQIAENDGVNNEYTLQADYTLPINQILKFETGTKGIFRIINSSYDFYNPNASGEFVLNPLTSNQYDYRQNVYAGYGVLSASLKNGFGFQVGARVEKTDIEGNSINANSGFLPFNNSYTNLVPNLAVSKTFKKNQTVKLSYSKRIQRPSLQFLNPFRNTSNPLNQTQGNPELSPEISQTLELGYSTFLGSSVINASVYYRHTDDVIESFIRTVPFTTVDNEGNTITRNVSLTNFGNIGQNNSVGGSLFGSVNLWKVVTLRGNINLFTYKPQATASFLQTSDDTYLQYNMFVSGGLKLGNGFSAETFVIQNSPRRTFQGQNPSFSLWTIGLKKEILNKKGSIGLNVVEPLNERKNFTSNIDNGALKQYSQFSVPFRSVGVNFSWSFGKMNFNPMPRKKRGIDNDDLKQGEGQGGQGGQMGQ